MRPRRAWLPVVALLAACSVAPAAPTSRPPTSADQASDDPATAERHRPLRSTATDAATAAGPGSDADDCSSAFYWEHPDCPLPVLVATDDIEPAGVGVDEIAPIDEPGFESIGGAARWLSDDSPLLVVTVAGETKAYPLAILVWHEIVEVATPAGPVVVWWEPGQTRAVDGARVDDGRDVGQTAAVRPVTAGGRRLTFTPVGDDGFVDAQTGSAWDLFGRAVAGPLAGAQLERVAHDDTFLFAWHAFHSSTRIVDGSGQALAPAPSAS